MQVMFEHTVSKPGVKNDAEEDIDDDEMDQDEVDHDNTNLNDTGVDSEWEPGSNWPNIACYIYHIKTACRGIHV